MATRRKPMVSNPEGRLVLRDSGKGRTLFRAPARQCARVIIYMNLGRNTDRDGQQRRHRLGADRSGVHHVGQDRT